MRRNTSLQYTVRKFLAAAGIAAVCFPLIAGIGRAVRGSESGPGPAHLFIVVQNGKYGFIDTTGKIVIRPRFDYAVAFKNGFARVQVGNAFTYIDKTGRMIAKSQFDAPLDFSDGLARVGMGGRYGYINASGKVVIKPRYSGAQPFSEGLAAVEIGGRYGYIDKSGKVVVKPVIDGDDVDAFEGGIVCIEVHKRFGYVDRTGRIIIKPVLNGVLDFEEGLAAIERLPVSQRSVIRLRDVEGYSADEVCDMLGISAANQRVLLHRARSRVRQALEAYFTEV